MAATESAPRTPAAVPASPPGWAGLLRRLLQRAAQRRQRQGARRALPAGIDAASARRIGRLMAICLGGVAAGAAAAATLAPDKGELLYHYYDGGGVTASGPALLVRKGLNDRMALSGSYYVDAVSNASIDVVTTASPFRETRTAYDIGLDYVHRDAQINVGLARSDEPDYVSDALSLDVAQDVFGGMSTVSVGFTRSSDKVGQKGVGFFDSARHWQYRVGLTQILSPRWMASANFEIVADEGHLGSPYRAARVFGAAVPERNPRTRSSRALKLRSIHAVGERASWRAEYRYFWDNWDISAHTLETGYARHVGQAWLLDGFLRFHTQGSALFYSDNATAQTRYVSRNRQLSEFQSWALGLKATWTLPQATLARYGTRLSGGYEFKQFRFGDFTDLRTGALYRFDAHLLQLTLSATF